MARFSKFQLKILNVTFRYHPFYICDSPEGGFGQKSEMEQKRQRVFAGVAYDSEGYPYPTAGKFILFHTFSSNFVRKRGVLK